jgi:hypothetical protein
MKLDGTVPQTEPLREVGANGQPKTAANSAGGQSFVVDDAMALTMPSPRPTPPITCPPCCA